MSTSCWDLAFPGWITPSLPGLPSQVATFPSSVCGTCGMLPQGPTDRGWQSVGAVGSVSCDLRAEASSVALPVICLSSKSAELLVFVKNTVGDLLCGRCRILGLTLIIYSSPLPWVCDCTGTWSPLSWLLLLLKFSEL